MTVDPRHYLERASQLETAARNISDGHFRASYLELARAFRQVANLAGLARMSSDQEVLHLAERMVGKSTAPSRADALGDNDNQLV